MIKISQFFLILYLFITPSGAAMGPINVYLDDIDPLEELNRPIFVFNQTLDQNLIEPIAISYRDNTPEEIKKGVSNFFSNLGEVSTLANQILQFKAEDSFITISRLLINTTVGLAGIFDPASELGLIKKDEDFGQTLGFWGVPEGPYFVIPILGPSTLRDTAGLYVDMTSDVNLINNLDTNGEIAATSMKTVDKRVELLPATDLINGSFDPYTTMRSSYLQKRRNDVNDGIDKNNSSDF